MMDEHVCPLDLTGYRPAQARDQVQPMLIWAKVDDLVVDRRYQRPITFVGRRAIQKIADAFDWTKFEPIVVAPAADGKLAIVDGQHRAHGAALAGIDRVPAMSVAMTLQEQALGFAAINKDRIRMSLHQIYRAELAAGRDWAVACRDAVDAAGCTLATSNGSAATKRPKVIYSIGLIRRMVLAGEGAAVTAGLAACAKSASAEDREAYSGPVLGVWLPAIARNQQFMRLDLAALFDTIDIMSLLEDGRQRARREGGVGKLIATDAVAAVLAQARAAA